MKKKYLITGLVLLLLIGSGFNVLACTTIMVGKEASVDGSVMTTHTCDGSYDARIQIIPGEKFEDGVLTGVYRDLCHDTIPGRTVKQVGEIPQAAETNTYFHIGYPFMNEYQVMIGEATFSGQRGARNDQALMMIEQLEVFGLQRGQTAREVVRVMGKLAEKYGYADGGETLTVIDPDEAWVFEIIGPGPLWTPESGQPGAVWAAVRIPDDHVTVTANRSRIGELDLANPENYMASENVFSLAKEMGWWDGEETFLFWKAYCPDPYGSPYYQRRREWRVLSLLAPSLNLDPSAEHYPFSIKPDKKISVQDLMAINRDHYEGTEFDLTTGMAAGPFGNPNRYATPGSVKPEDRKSLDWERAISIFRCSYSFVAQARSWLPDPIGGVLWFGEDAPHSTCYLPIYCGTTKLPDSITSGRRDQFDRNSAWWAFDFVSNWADLKYSYIMVDINELQEELEGSFFAMQPAVEEAALKMYENDPQLAIKFLSDYTFNTANSTVERWWDLAEDLIYKYNDGYADGNSVGYPTWWLEEVGFAETMLDQ